MNYKLKIGRLSSFLLIASLLIGLGSIKAQQKDRNSLFWEISGNGLRKPSYLFGTYHFADKGFIDTMKRVNTALAAADVIVGELVMDQTMAMKLMPYMMLKDTTLDKLLSPTEYQAVADYLKRATNMDLKLLNTFTPIAVQTILEQANAPKTFSANNPAIDLYFQDYARAAHKKVIGLETLEEQATVLFGSTLERQKELLLKTVSNGSKAKAESEKLYQYYIAQNLKGLEQLFTADTDYTPEEIDRLLYNRNKNWLSQLPTMMKDQSLFIAVGAGHLIGKQGLIKGLQEKGYTVKPVRVD
ncbi:MAG: TraB/GumN family protein [Pedobacter sp.]|nr:TraB/GumN family protein [Pedobacter sp.]MDQ8053120.1 TraB/GumN family protein [Pedobacter sp.]